MTSAVGCIASGIAIGTLVACGTLIPTGGGGADDKPPATPATTGVDGGVYGSSAGTGATGNGSVDPCAASLRPGAADVYVTTSGSPDADCGTTAKPCTLQAALGRGPVVIDIADGDYPIDLALKGDVTIRGGWGATWIRSCKAGGVHFMGVERPRAVIESGAVTLSYVGFVSKPTAGEGESLYGLFITGSKVTLDHVDIQVAKGGDGASGAVSTIIPSSAVCTTNTDGNGTTGGPGGTGTPGASAFVSDGITEIAGGQGGTGAQGGNGNAPLLEPVLTKGSSCTDPTGTDPATQCSPSTCLHPPALRGSRGCGGDGGGGGHPGKNGGASVGLYVWSSNVTVNDSSIGRSNGGTGGAGGAGAMGGAGTQGSPGEDSSDPTCFEPTSVTCGGLIGGQCKNAFPPFTIPGGPPGSPGGPGGVGGAGGGGAGGASYAWVKDPTSSVAFVSTTFLPQGAGGAPGAPNGASGGEGEHPPL